MSRIPTLILRRKAIAVAVALSLTALIGGVYATTGDKKSESAAMHAPHLATVSVAQVIQRNVTEWDEFSGRLEAVERVEIRPRVAGAIDAVHFQEGQLVKKGDPLFTIDPRPYAAEVSRAEAALAGAQARAELAKTELDRAKRLLDQRAIAQREFDQRENGVREAEANLRAAQASLQSARLDLNHTRITSPVTGRVSRAELTLGNLVAAGPAAPVLTTVVSVSPMYVNFEADERTYLKYVAQGTAGNTGVSNIPVFMGLANEEGHPRKGAVKSVDNRLDPQSGTIRVRAVVDNKSGVLTPGLFVRVKIGGSGERQALLINDRAVGTDQSKKFVFVVGSDNKVSYREVRLGAAVDGLRVVADGLRSGESIVVAGLQRIRPGEAVNPQNVAMDAKPELLTKKAADEQHAESQRTLDIKKPGA